MDRVYKKWFRVTLALAWLLCCNSATAETLFMALGDVGYSHSHSDSKQDHHTNHHAGHSLPHEHEGMPNHGPHGLNHSSNNMALRSPVPVKPIKIVALIPLPLVLEFADAVETRCLSCISLFQEDRPPKTFQYIGSAPTRAPPTHL